MNTEKNKNMWWPVWIAVIAGSIAVIGAYYQVKEKNRDENKAKSRERDLKNQLDSLNEHLGEITKLNNRLLDKQDTLERKNNELRNQVESNYVENIKILKGDGVVDISIRKFKHQFMFKLENNTKYDFYDSKFFIWKNDEFIRCIKNIEEDRVIVDDYCAEKSVIKGFGGTLPANKSTDIDYPCEMPKATDSYYLRLEFKHATFVYFILITPDSFYRECFQMFPDGSLKRLTNDPESKWEKWSEVFPYFGKRIIANYE